MPYSASLFSSPQPFSLLLHPPRSRPLLRSPFNICLALKLHSAGDRNRLRALAKEPLRCLCQPLICNSYADRKQRGNERGKRHRRWRKRQKEKFALKTQWIATLRSRRTVWASLSRVFFFFYVPLLRGSWIMWWSQYRRGLRNAVKAAKNNGNVSKLLTRASAFIRTSLNASTWSKRDPNTKASIIQHVTVAVLSSVAEKHEVALVHRWRHRCMDTLDGSDWLSWMWEAAFCRFILLVLTKAGKTLLRAAHENHRRREWDGSYCRLEEGHWRFSLMALARPLHSLWALTEGRLYLPSLGTSSSFLCVAFKADVSI